MPILHSTKNLHIIEPATSARTGVAVFEYTDNYTVFHYGRMPDVIAGKGEASCRMAVANFALLQKAGVPTHFRRWIPPNRVEFDLGRLPDPKSGRPLNGRNRLVPVQVLIRNGLPQGSSVHRRLASGALTPSDIGLHHTPKAGENLPEPIIEYATMVEQTNRYVKQPEAQHLAGLDGAQFQQMHTLALTVNTIISDHARDRGINHCDGKVEFLIDDDGSLAVADSPGTPDESRLTYNAVHCGKQVLRNWYAHHGLDTLISRLVAEGVPRSHWPQPAPLPPEFLPVMSNLYRSLTQTWIGAPAPNTPSLASATQAVARVIGS